MSDKVRATFHDGGVPEPVFTHHRVEAIATKQGRVWSCTLCPGVWTDPTSIPPDGCTPRPVFTDDPEPTGTGQDTERGTNPA